MVREYKCGLIAPEEREQALELLRRVPRPGSNDYAELLKGMEEFHQAHSVKSLRDRVVQELLG